MRSTRASCWIKGRIKTVPLKQWLVGRELRRRIAKVFRERSIGIALPQMNLKMAAKEPGPTNLTPDT